MFRVIQAKDYTYKRIKINAAKNDMLIYEYVEYLMKQEEKRMEEST